MSMKWNDWSVILVKNIVNPIRLYDGIPEERGAIRYNPDGVVWEPSEGPLGVDGSLSRYNHPKYRELHYELKSKIENVIGDVLYPSYFYDRFYFKGQELVEHTDRPACEVSISINCSHNLDYDWPIWFRTPEGDDIPLITNPGDAVIYKGEERPHWRKPMKGNAKSYFHQLFMHYVRRDGPHLEHAYDKSNTINKL